MPDNPNYRDAPNSEAGVERPIAGATYPRTESDEYETSEIEAALEQVLNEFGVTEIELESLIQLLDHGLNSHGRQILNNLTEETEIFYRFRNFLLSCPDPITTIKIIFKVLNHFNASIDLIKYLLSSIDPLATLEEIIQQQNKEKRRIYDTIRLYRERALGGIDEIYLADPRLVVEMPFVGKGAKNANSAGFLRDANYYWSEMIRSMPEAFDGFNLDIIAGKHEYLTSPVNNATFRKHFSQFDLPGLRGKTLVHHHIGGGGQAVGIPQPLHKGFGGIHNLEKMLGIWGGDDLVAEVLQGLLSASYDIL